jgi:hypothetical protein
MSTIFASCFQNAKKGGFCALLAIHTPPAGAGAGK